MSQREPINRYRPLTQGEARALGGGLMRVPTEKETNKGDYVEYSEYQQLAADHAALVEQGIRDHADWRSKLNFLEADYKAEIARLTAEVEHLKTRPTLANQYAEYAALAAENERLKETIQGERAIHRQNTSMWKDSIERFRFDYLQLNEENERLRKAGDAIVKDNLKWITNHDHIAAWNAAKEGRDAK